MLQEGARCGTRIYLPLFILIVKFYGDLFYLFVFNNGITDGMGYSPYCGAVNSPSRVK